MGDDEAITSEPEATLELQTGICVEQDQSMARHMFDSVQNLLWPALPLERVQWVR